MAAAPSSPAVDGDLEEAGQVPLGVGPGPGSYSLKDRALGLGPERARDGQRPSTLRGGSHGLDPGVGVGDALDHAISLEPIEAARQGRLVDGEPVFELFQIRATQAREGLKNAELGDPEPAGPQDVVIELGHRPRDHAEGAAHTRGEPDGIWGNSCPSARPDHALMLAAPRSRGKRRSMYTHACLCTYMG